MRSGSPGDPYYYFLKSSRAATILARVPVLLSGLGPLRARSRQQEDTGKRTLRPLHFCLTFIRVSSAISATRR
jgi:hypothetical protein